MANRQAIKGSKHRFLSITVTSMSRTEDAYKEEAFTTWGKMGRDFSSVSASCFHFGEKNA
jgi:hypothetical protein